MLAPEIRYAQYEFKIGISKELLSPVACMQMQFHAYRFWAALMSLFFS